MKITFLLLFICLTTESFSQEFLNLDFEYETHGSDIPKKWYIGSPGYVLILDENEKHSSKRSLKITSQYPMENQSGVFTGDFPVALAKGKNIEFRGSLKTEEIINGYAGLWWKVDGPDGVLSYDNMEDRGLKGTNDWQEVSIKMRVDEFATDISFGGLLEGSGVAWFDDLEILIDGEKFKDLKPRLTDPTKEELEWLKNNVHPLSTYDPNAKSDEDLNILDSLIGNAHVVALGEVTHGSSQIFQMKHRIIKYLAENEDFDIFSIEANMPEAYKLNDYIVDGTGNPTELIKGMHFWTWRTNEVLDMVKWMRLHNTSEQNIKFTGFDIQYYNLSIKVLQDALKNDPARMEDLADVERILDINSQQHRNSRMGAISEANKDISKEKLAAVREAITNLNIPKDNMDWLSQNVRIIEQYMAKTIFTRDKFMAENLLWIKSQNEESKIVIWAHNAHIQRTMHGMGNFLSDSLTDDYVSIGFAFNRGSYTAMGKNGLTGYQAQEPYNGTFERFFASIDVPIFIIDLRSVKEQRPLHANWLLEKLDFRQVGAMKVENEFYETDLAEDYDLIIFINESSNSKILD